MVYAHHLQGEYLRNLERTGALKQEAMSVAEIRRLLELARGSLPEDELNHAPRAGIHFGYPYRHQRDTPDTEHGV